MTLKRVVSVVENWEGVRSCLEKVQERKREGRREEGDREGRGKRERERGVETASVATSLKFAIKRGKALHGWYPGECVELNFSKMRMSHREDVIEEKRVIFWSHVLGQRPGTCPTLFVLPLLSQLQNGHKESIYSRLLVPAWSRHPAKIQAGDKSCSPGVRLGGGSPWPGLWQNATPFPPGSRQSQGKTWRWIPGEKGPHKSKCFLKNK